MNHRMLQERTPRWFGCGAVLILLAACSSERVPAQSASNVDNHTTVAIAPDRAADEAPADRDDSSATVKISEEVRRQCQLPDAPAEAPQFDFDESRLKPRGRDILADVAKCLSQGPMKGRPITIVGHTDPRGTERYNQQLALNRAQAARNYLLEHGVGETQVRLVSRGEAEAEGSTEQGWALDRRVDIEVDRDQHMTAGATRASDSDGDSERARNPFAEFRRIQASDPQPQDRDAMVYADQVEGAVVGTSTKDSTNGSARPSGRYR